MRRDLGNWRDLAACREHPDPDIFDAGGKGNIPVAALRVCRGCPVRDDCLDEVLSWPASDDIGMVWGGTTTGARRSIRRGRRTRGDAMQAGDSQASGRTHAEILADNEPWLTAAQAAS